jgi:hypothetical protein
MTHTQEGADHFGCDIKGCLNVSAANFAGIFLCSMHNVAVQSREKRIREEADTKAMELLHDFARAVGLLQGLDHPDEHLEKRYRLYLERLRVQGEGEQEV